MKKILAFVCAAVLSLGAFSATAQDAGKFGIGINALYGTEVEKPGIGIKAQYNITNPLRAELGFNYFFVESPASFWELNLNAHYLFEITNNFGIYPLAGLNISRVGSSEKISKGDTSVKFSSSHTELGANLGAGLEFRLSENASLNFEGKYVASEFDQGVVGVGLTYRF